MVRRSEFSLEEGKAKKGFCSGNRLLMIVLCLLVLVGLLAVIIYFTAFYTSGETSPPPEVVPTRSPTYAGTRMNCYPEAENQHVLLDREKCEARGCEFDPGADGDDIACFYKEKSFGYKVVKTSETPLGFELHLKQFGKAPFGGDIQDVVMSVEQRGDNLLRFKFDDPNSNRYKVPIDLNLPTVKATEPKYRVDILDQESLAFSIVRIETGTAIWNTSLAGFTISDQFLQITTILPSTNVYGFGENLHKTFRHSMKQSWPMFSRDQPPGWGDNNNLYGVHPFYTCVEDAVGNTHGVLLLNSNAQDYSFTEHPSLTYRTTGGILDFYVFMGPLPEQVIQQYTSVIGRPYMPPYWSLGFQLCRYGYDHIDNITKAVENTRGYNIPLDVQYADIDHMDERKDFTIDHTNFPDLNNYFNSLRDGGMHTIIILDPCLIANETDYEPYEKMKQVNGNVNWPKDIAVPDGSSDENNAVLGFVWPKGKVVFPDYFKNSTRQVWIELIKKHYDASLQFDGLWIDMNEPANFGTNEEKPWNWPEDAKPYWSLKCPHSQWDDPPYRTKAAYNHDNDQKTVRLSDKTICLSAVQGESGELRHYDVHSLYGWSQTQSTLDGLRLATNKRGLVISRSTFPGSGTNSGHWLGDNDSSWNAMAESIIGMLEFNLFGIPYIGADICGFWGNVEPELCKRWMQLGAFYTFSRNHNGKGNKPQDPGSLGEDVAMASREAIETRYWLLPYLYTLFHQVHVDGGTVIRPLHHEFPEDPVTLGIDRQFLWGPALLISPILEKGQTSLTYFVPKGVWYNFYSGVAVYGRSNATVSVSADTRIPLHIRGGFILPLQAPANNTEHSRKKPMKLLVALSDLDTSDHTTAEGQLFWDDGDSIDSYENGNYYFATFKAEKRSLKINVAYNNMAEVSSLHYNDIEIMGVASAVSHVKGVSSSNQEFNLEYSHNKTTRVLKMTNISIPLAESFMLYWGNFSEDLLSRIDCYPEGSTYAFSVNEAKCLQRGCLYDPHQHPALPPCYYPRANLGYSVQYVNTTSPTEVVVGLRGVGSSVFPNQKANLEFKLEMISDTLVRFQFDEPESERYKVPKKLNLPTTRNLTSPLYEFKITDNSTFAFQIVRKTTGTVIFDTGVGGLIFAEQFLQISTRLPSVNIYGMGENIHQSFRHDVWYKHWAMFARDEPTVDGFGKYRNHYGVHPFYTVVEDDGTSHGVLIFNSNAQDYSFSPLPMLTYRTTGGILDFYVFMGPSPEQVIQQYTTVIGKPYMPPYWALGFQLCRYGYNKLSNLKAALERTKMADIPHDVQYADIDHMDERKDFTIDQKNFRHLDIYFKELREEGMRTIIILDPCIISNETDYKPYQDLKDISGAIKWSTGVDIPTGSNDTDGAMLGFVWPKGKVVFPDYFNSETRQLWKKWIVDHVKVIPFDGLWIDMNEPANFGTNEDKPWNWPEDAKPYWSLKCPHSQWDDPPYATLATYIYGNKTRISDKTICMVGRQGDNGEYRHYDVHNLYGWSQTEPTLQGLREGTGERGLVVTRSTFPGSGQYSGHWLGDNKSSWKDMRLSIIGMLEFNLFGIPYIGADICGFFDNTTVELCKRWMQLGAFYPYSRNHNGNGFKDQDPGYLGEEVTTISRTVLNTRYQLLPYLYTLFHLAHTQGGTVVRALHHQFSTDKNTYGINEQFMWGNSLLISPILYPNQVNLNLYLPKGVWYDFYTHEAVKSEGKWTQREVEPDSSIPLHIRGGSILVLQDHARNTRLSRKNPMRLMVTLDETLKGEGQLFWDDGQSIDTYENGKYFLAKFTATKDSISMSIDYNVLPEVNDLHLSTITVLGVPGGAEGVRLPEDNIDLPFTYNHSNMVLTINHKFPLNQEFQIDIIRIPKSYFSRIDCYPEIQGGVVTVTRELCEGRGCVYDGTTPGGGEVPSCYFNTSGSGYETGGGRQETDLGYKIPLTKMSGRTPFGPGIEEIVFEVQELEEHLLRVKIYEPNEVRYEVPIQLNLPDSRPTEPRYELSYSDNGTFSFRIVRKSTGNVLWDTSVSGLTFSDQFLQIATKLPSGNVYGFGENTKSSFRHDLWFKSWTMFSRDENTVTDKNINHYGVHPFYMCMEDDGQSHGVLLLNSNAQDYSFSPLPMLTYRTIGGILDLYFFLGPEPENVVQQYTTLIGKPFMPPYWSLGFQLSRYNYNTISAMQEAINRTREAGIPQDVQVADIDHMDERKDFTIDHVNYPGLKDYFQSLREDGMRTIIILDPALIVNETDYEPYERMMEVNGNIKWPANFNIPEDSSVGNRSVLGFVWPKGKVIFPDFFKNETRQVWAELIRDHYQKVPFDGIWIDMNEPANFGTNEEKPWNWPEDAKPYWSLKCSNNTWDSPPYRTGSAYYYDSQTSLGRLSDKTLCMNHRQGNLEEYRHYDVHSLYGWSQTLPTLQGTRMATGNKERGIVLSRSTFPGSGVWSVHWLGDNRSSWKQMLYSLPGILDFNLFGIPFVGADVCGFFENTTPELCKRWMQLGAFYTFSRNHNGRDNIPQDPGSLGEDVAMASREAIETRYWLLPYLYTLFHQVHVDGGTVIRPLHHEFPRDKQTYGIYKQFLWGPALLISPILYQGQTSLTLYVPGSRWYDFYTGQKSSEGGEMLHMAITPDSKIPLHMRAGYIIPLQEPANNTKYSRQKPFELVVAMENVPGRGLQASGELFWDDGVSIDTYETGAYLSLRFECKQNELEIRVEHSNTTDSSTMMLNTVLVLGLEDWVTHVFINGSIHNNFINDHEKKTLLIQAMNLAFADNTVISWSKSRPPTEAESERIDCLPDTHKFTDKVSECHRRRCIWRPVTDADGVPDCYINNDLYGYTLTSEVTNGNRQDLMLKWRNQSQMFTDDIHDIAMAIDMINDDVVRFKIYDPNNARYEVPIPLNIQRSSVSSPQYKFNYDNSSRTGFSFSINRKSTNTKLWDTSIGGLTFADQFLQIATKLPSNNVFGFGENRHFNLRHNFDYQRWPMFSRDQAPGWGDYGNLYGVHPFYLNIEDDQGNSHGVLLLNSNAMEVVLQSTPALTYRTIGGVLDFYIFLGPSPEAVIQQYTQMIGRPYLPPYWSLGFQLCRYGYNSLDTLKEVVDRTIAADIPYDVQYGDIDHMDERKDFTIDPINFAGFPELVKKYQSQGLKFIIILDPALISNETNYPAYDLGLQQDVYIKWPSGTNPDYDDYQNDNMLGYVWPKGKTVFPDFLKNETWDYWSKLIVDHHKILSFDGLWIDMNEPANFGTNEERPFNWPEKDRPYWSLKCRENKWDDPPYKPVGVFGGRLSEKTLCMVGVQKDGEYRHYDVHSLYGWSQTLPTLQALQTSTGKRGLVITRSTYPGSGQYSGHWLGDNNSEWPHLYDSIIGSIEFNLFGIPYIGADICGFFSNSWEELCERWMQVGAFYTYSRNHNGLFNRPQDPASFGPGVASSSRKALRTRYTLLPYLYTLFYNVNLNGGTVIRALWHEFPSDKATWSVETQFMWGSGFMIAPVVHPGQFRRNVYFPDTVWYDYYKGDMVGVRGGVKAVPAPRDVIPLYIRGGSVLPTQLPANNTAYSRLNPLGLIVAPDESGQGSGSLFWDDGESINTVRKGEYFTAEFSFINNTLSMTIGRNHSTVSSLKFDRIRVFNVLSRPSNVQVSGRSSRQTATSIHYASLYKVLTITGLEIPLTENFSITWY